MSEVVKFSIPSLIIVVVVETDIEDEKRLRFSMKIFPIFFFHDEEQHEEELVPTNDAKYTQRRRRKCGRDRPFDAFLKRERV